MLTFFIILATVLWLAFGFLASGYAYAFLRHFEYYERGTNKRWGALLCSMLGFIMGPVFLLLLWLNGETEWGWRMPGT